MWIHHIGEIAIGFFIFLMLAHFSLHILFKIQKRKEDNKKKADKELEMQGETK